MIVTTGRASICGGGEVVFNTTHPNYFNSLLVENLWMCNNVSHSIFTYFLESRIILTNFKSNLFTFSLLYQLH